MSTTTTAASQATADAHAADHTRDHHAGRAHTLTPGDAQQARRAAAAQLASKYATQRAAEAHRRTGRHARAAVARRATQEAGTEAAG